MTSAQKSRVADDRLFSGKSLWRMMLAQKSRVAYENSAAKVADVFRRPKKAVLTMKIVLC